MVCCSMQTQGFRKEDAELGTRDHAVQLYSDIIQKSRMRQAYTGQDDGCTKIPITCC